MRVTVICLLMTGFCVGSGDHLVAASFAMNLVCVAVINLMNKEN